MKPYCQPNIIAASTVLNTTRNSVAVQIYNAFLCAIQIVFTGTPTGTFKLQVSCDPAAAATATGRLVTANEPTHWTDLANSSFSVSAAGDVSWGISGGDLGYNWVRVVYTDGSGGLSTAIVTVSTANIKGF